MQLSQSIVRRRKEDTGEPLVERTYCPVRVRSASASASRTRSG